MSARDYTNDNNPDLLLYADEQIGIPDYVKESPIISAEDTEKLAPAAFADPKNRRLPGHTKAACWTSACWCAGRKVDGPEVLEALVKMAKSHGIYEDVQKVIDLFNPLNKEASTRVEVDIVEPSEQKYALTVDYEGHEGRGIEHYFPINTPGEVIAAGHQLNTAYKQHLIPDSVMRKAAMAIVEQGDEFDIPASDFPCTVAIYGEDRLPDAEKAELLLQSNTTSSKEELLQALKDGIANASSLEDGIACAEDIAQRLHLANVQEGNDNYTEENPSPFIAIFSGPTKQAFMKAAGKTVSILGVSVPSFELANMPMERIDAVFSPEAASILKQASTTIRSAESIATCAYADNLIKSLPTDVQKVLLNQLAEHLW